MLSFEKIILETMGKRWGQVQGGCWGVVHAKNVSVLGLYVGGHGIGEKWRDLIIIRRENGQELVMSWLWCVGGRWRKWCQGWPLRFYSTKLDVGRTIPWERRHRRREGGLGLGETILRSDLDKWHLRCHMEFMVLKSIGEIWAGDTHFEVICKYPVGCSKFSRWAQLGCI